MKQQEKRLAKRTRRTKRAKLAWSALFCFWMLAGMLTVCGATGAGAEEALPPETSVLAESGSSEADAFEEWLADWLREQVAPTLISTGVVLGTALLELLPAVRALGRAKRQFEAVAERTEGEARARREREAAWQAQTDAWYRAADERVARCEAALQSTTARLEEDLQRVRAGEQALSAQLRLAGACAARTERMVYLGMTNAAELVRNGAARQIARVAEEASIAEEASLTADALEEISLAEKGSNEGEEGTACADASS